jgi:hypothetical protein
MSVCLVPSIHEFSWKLPVVGPMADELYVAVIAFYLSKLHQIVMQSWRRFAQTTQATAEANSHVHRSRTIRYQQDEATRLEGTRRQIEILRPHLWEPTFLSLHSPV